jgi:hypothetical protein
MNFIEYLDILFLKPWTKHYKRIEKRKKKKDEKQVGQKNNEFGDCGKSSSSKNS